MNIAVLKSRRKGFNGPWPLVSTKTHSNKGKPLKTPEEQFRELYEAATKVPKPVFYTGVAGAKLIGEAMRKEVKPSEGCRPPYYKETVAEYLERKQLCRTQSRLIKGGSKF